MTIQFDPFVDSKTLSIWVASTLKKRGVDELSQWQMLEYWMQVELYRAIESGQAGVWRHMGKYEQPYYTNCPRSGSKDKVKYVDLVLASLEATQPNRVMWIELKDLGRYSERLPFNAQGVGHDLAALYKIDVAKTIETWQNPPAHVKNAGRAAEWNKLAPGLHNAEHLISQIVLVEGKLASQEETIRQEWLNTFKRRAKSDVEADIESCATECFKIFAIILRPLH